jgi:hypothetical protein
MKRVSPDQPSAGLPAIPDIQSPLPAWQHFHILKFAESQIHAELAQAGYKGHLVGLRVDYVIKSPAPPDEGEFTMFYGYGVSDDGFKVKSRRKSPLTQEFFLRLYDNLSSLIAQNISQDVNEFIVRLDAALNPTLMHYGVVCRVCLDGECSIQHSDCVGKPRLLFSDNNGWHCTHREC